jgi:hypothetical protein
MVYGIEFIRRIDGKAEMIAQEAISLVGESLAMVIAQARDLYRRFEAVPRPDGFRIVESGAVIYEFAESPNT